MSYADAMVAIASVCFFLIVPSWLGFRLRPQGGHFDHVAALVALALVPTALSVWSALVLATTSWLMPGWFFLAAGPALISIWAAVSLLRHGWAAGPVRWLPTVRNTVLLIAVSLALAPLLTAMVLEVQRLRIDHDISIYLIEASALSLAMREGFSSPFGLLDFSHPIIAHPHGISFSAYLALGFLGTSTPGFGDDLPARILVGLSQISFLSAFVALPAMLTQRNRFLTGLLALGFLVFDPTWHYQINAASRDVFYLAPLLVMIGLLAKARPCWPGYWRLAALSLATYGALNGHSLGIVYVCAAVLAIGLVKLIAYRASCFRITELWVAGLSAIAAGTMLLTRYFGADGGTIGFSYPYYAADPALQQHFEDSTLFLSSPGFLEFIGGVYGGSSPAITMCGVVVLTVLMSMPRLRARGRTGGVTAMAVSPLTQMSLIVLTANALVLFAPIERDGISLASAFVSNFRYGFGMTALFLLAASMVVVALLSATILSQPSPTTPVTAVQRAYRPILILGILTAIALGGQASLAEVRSTSAIYERLARAEAASCAYARDGGARQIYLDSGSTIYRCGKDAQFLLTDMGLPIIAARGDENVVLALDEQDVDAVIFHNNLLEGSWRETRLVDFLERRWQKHVEFENLTVFVRNGNGG